MVPFSQGAVIGSNASFNCSATGYPKPTITWKKDNDSVSIQPVIKTDDQKTLSQLIITRVTSKDYGKYVCVANNSAGVETSNAAVLYQGDLSLSVIKRFDFGSFHVECFWIVFYSLRIFDK